LHSTRPKFEHDSRKGAKLVAAGLMVMRVTWNQMEDEPYAVVARTAQALIRAA
jgi:very-short-patch-repair endonuclease